MTRRRKLIVAGCSFSDRFKVDRCYGDILSEKLSMDYLHEARSCGSNHRIWRTVTNHILDGNITEEDVLLVQYTEFSRMEFATWIDQSRNDSMAEPYRDGTWIVRYKLDIDKMYHDRTTRHFLKAYNDNFVHRSFEDDKFRSNNYMFQCMLANRGINAWFLNLSCYRPFDYIWSTIPYFNDRVISDHSVLQESPWRLSDDDRWHLSHEGHGKVADDVYETIRDRI